MVFIYNINFLNKQILVTGWPDFEISRGPKNGTFREPCRRELDTKGEVLLVGCDRLGITKAIPHVDAAVLR